MNFTYIYIVDVENGVEAEGTFTATGKHIKAFGGEKSLYDYIAKVVDTKYEEVVSRITNITKYTFGGTIEKFNLAFNDGNIELVSKGVVQSDVEVEIPGDAV